MAFTSRRLTLVNSAFSSRFDGVASSLSAPARKMSRPVREIASGAGTIPGEFTSDLSAVGYFGAGTQYRTFDSFLPDNSEETLIPFYRDIYYFDAIGGSAVDLTATFPFSDWTLSGVDNKYLEVYSDTLARLNMRTLLPEMALSYLVDGDFIGTLIYNSELKNFYDIMIHDRLFCRVIPSPFYSMDPIIQAQASAKLRMFLNTGSRHASQMLKNYPEKLINAMNAGAVELDPLTTLHIARRSLPDRMSGSVSYLKRLLPIYLLEKTLYRGTLVEFNKRMRATTHIQAGDAEWEPTDAEMEDLLNKFQSTEMDPLGAWIVTRQGVNIQDIRQGGDFLKWTDMTETLVPLKLRALGISEAFLAGDASYATAESAVTVFMENVDAFRNFFTMKIFNYKIFPMVALANGFYKKGVVPKKNATIREILFNANNQKDLEIPKLIWNKDLTAKEGSSKIDMLEKLSEKGMPIALRTWAAAAGLDVSSLMSDLSEEGAEDFNKLLMGFKAQTKKFTEGEEEKGGGGFGNYASTLPLMKRGLGNRDYGDPKPHVLGRTGKPKSVLNEHQHMRKENDAIVRAVMKLQDPEHRAVARKRVQNRYGKIPKIL